MAKSYKTPGVYTEEIPKLPLSITSVETAIPAFVGYTERAGMDEKPIPRETIGNTLVTEAKRITSLLEYETYFGKTPPEAIAVSIQESYSLGNPGVTKRVILATLTTPTKQTLYYHMQLYFSNGGGPCYIISVGSTDSQTVASVDLLAGLEMAKKHDEPTLLVIPQAIEIINAKDCYEVYDSALMQAGQMTDRFVVMDCHADTPDSLRGTNGIGMANLKFGVAYHPFLQTTIAYLYDTADARFTLELKKGRSDDGIFAPEDTARPTFDALNPELQALVKLELNNLKVTLPPSAAIAGIYATVDRTRGVWKAPANVSLNMVSGLSKRVTDEEQDVMNVDVVAGKSVNAIRAFVGKGILVWGTRTLAGNDNEWRYVNVRRFVNMVEESWLKAMKGFVFEANDPNTWQRVQAMLENFLSTLWRQGAMQGTKPEHAFYVAVGLNKTMTALDVKQGKMIVEIGMAVVRPSEFILIKLTRHMSED
jgi:phage tail sheath protein FI